MNNAVSSSTKRTPYEINFGYHPDFDGLGNGDKSQVPSLNIYMDKLKTIWIDTIKNLRETASRMKKNTEKLRTAMSFKVGDFVWLDTEHLKRSRPSRKLDYQRIGPFKIIEKINENAYRLKLPVGSRLHDVVNISKLTPYVDAKGSSRKFEPEPDLIKGFEEFEVEEILDQKNVKDVSWYLIKWKGYSELHNSWEPETNLTNCEETLMNYKKSRRLGISAN